MRNQNAGRIRRGKLTEFQAVISVGTENVHDGGLEIDFPPALGAVHAAFPVLIFQREESDGRRIDIDSSGGSRFFARGRFSSAPCQVNLGRVYCTIGDRPGQSGCVKENCSSEFCNESTEFWGRFYLGRGARLRLQLFYIRIVVHIGLSNAGHYYSALASDE
jgi:ribosomal protein S8E